MELKKSAYLNAAPPAADHSAELEALKKENARLQEKNEVSREGWMMTSLDMICQFAISFREIIRSRS